MFNIITDMGYMWSMDAQEIEGTNNTVQHIGRLAPHINWRLLASRIMIKKQLTLLPSRGDRAEFLEGCELRHQRAVKIMEEEKARCSLPMPEDYPTAPEPPGPPKPKRKPTPSGICFVDIKKS